MTRLSDCVMLMVHQVTPVRSRVTFNTYGEGVVYKALFHRRPIWRSGLMVRCAAEVENCIIVKNQQ